MDLDSQRPATPQTLFATASTGKLVTAELVMELVQRHKLSLRTRLSRFYPRLPNARRITIRMLLNHTSGLSEYFDDPRINRIIAAEPTHRWKRSEVIRAIRKSVFRPGARFQYTNSNYVVFGGVIEKLARRSFERAFRARVAARVGMPSSTTTYDPARSGLFAHPYFLGGGGLHDGFVPGVGIPADYWGTVWTDGGLASTAADMARFGDGLFEGRLLRRATLRLMTRVGRSSAYGLGVQAMRFAGRRWLGHNGAYNGYGAEVWNDASRGVTVVVLSNASGHVGADLAGGGGGVRPGGA